MGEQTERQGDLQELHKAVAAYDREKDRERTARTLAEKARHDRPGDANDLVARLLDAGPDVIGQAMFEADIAERRGGIYVTSAALTGWPTSAELTPEAAAVVAELGATATIMIIDTPEGLHDMFGGRCDDMVEQLLAWHRSTRGTDGDRREG